MRSPLNEVERETITTPRASMPTNRRPIALSDERRDRRGDEAHAADHHDGPDRRADDPREPQEERDGDPGQDAVGQGVADEGEPAQHDEGADDRAGDRDEDARRGAPGA